MNVASGITGTPSGGGQSDREVLERDNRICQGCGAQLGLCRGVTISSQCPRAARNLTPTTCRRFAAAATFASPPPSAGVFPTRERERWKAYLIDTMQKTLLHLVYRPTNVPMYKTRNRPT